jgi:hypothetical protein
LSQLIQRRRKTASKLHEKQKKVQILETGTFWPSYGFWDKLVQDHPMNKGFTEEG